MNVLDVEVDMTLENAKRAVMEQFKLTSGGRKYTQAVHTKVWSATEAGLCNKGPACHHKGQNPSLGG